MNKILIQIISIFLIIAGWSCSPGLMSKKSTDTALMSVTSDSLFSGTVDKLIKDGKINRISRDAAVRYFDLKLLSDDSTFQQAFELLKMKGDTIQSALMLNSLAWKYRFQQDLADRFLNLSEYAVSLADIPGLADDIRDKYPAISGDFDKYWANIHDTYAWYLVRYDETQAALDEYERILRRYESAPIYLNYAELLSRINRYEEALQVSIRALELSPSDQDAMHMIMETGRTLAYEESAIQALLKKAGDQGKELLLDDIRKHQVNEPLPSYQASTLDGTVVASAIYSGTRQLILVWSIACIPCRDLMDRCQMISENVSVENSIKFYTVSTDKNDTVLRPFMTERNYSFPVLQGSDIVRQMAISEVPAVLIVDENGMIRYKLTGIQYLRELPVIYDLFGGNVPLLP